MKNNKILHIAKIITLTWLLVFQSCSEDVLDTAPSDQVDLELAVSSVANAEATLLGAYSRFRSGLYYTGTFTALGDIMTGNASITAINNGIYAFMYRYDFNSATQTVDDVWNRVYSIIGNVNPIIVAMPDYNNLNDPDIARKDQITGEAHALRALAYFDLLRVYGERMTNPTSEFGVPIPPAQIIPSTDPQPRSSVQEVLNLITSDLNTALGLLDGDESDKTRVNRNMVYALLSRVYLYTENYTEAINAANNVSGVSLINNAGTYNSFWTNSSGSELIWKIAVTPVDGANQFSWTYLFPVNTIRQDYIVTQEVLDLYEAGDYRRSVYYNPIQSSSDGQVRNTVIKFRDNPAINQSGVVEIMPFRYSEVILNRMEAYFESGNEGNALNDLNTLRAARGLGSVSLSGSSLRQAIRDERRKELAFEGHYWHDLKRWQSDMVRIQEESCTNCTLTIPSNSNFWLFPVPVAETDVNPNITQAPGYSN
ncbi:RagB/SusD family nutrient uptake outer membrane protein [Pseudotenacibaculum sp. MALMAid0570]|uniref:RagB/SusD family nutrient uptake outer membrane protein n=1 Tax=Pseudotenacibaculum sp. MALMAid0570 TaxID=3143938 RepID=UPI0032DFEC31